MSVIRKILCNKNIIKKQFKTTLYSATLFKRNHHCNDPQNKFVFHSDLEDVEIPNISIDEYVFSKIDKWPQRIATECAVTGRKYTYEEVQIKTTNLSRALRKKLKLQKGDVIAVLLPNSPEFLIAILGALRAGLIVTTLNPIYTPDEISRQLSDSSTKAIITFTDLFPLAKATQALLKHSLSIITIKTQQNQGISDGAFNFDEFTQTIDFPDLSPANPGDIAFLPYSSGTTGLPKGVELTHRNIIANMCQFNSPELSVVRETTNDHQDVIPAVLPKFHIYGLTATTLHLFRKGCKTVEIPKFNPEVYINTLKKQKPHVLFVAPPLVLFLTGHPAVSAKDLESVRTVMSGAAPLGGLDEERFLQKAQKKIGIFQGYGLTETSPLVAMTRADLQQLPTSAGSIGRPISRTSIKIADPNDPESKALGPNQTGEFLIKGPQVMRGYHKRPQQTQEAFTKDGWFKSGDMMYYNDDKLLFVSDRLKELVKVKGFQVPPAELEEIIRDYPDVEDAAVIGIPHQASGEVPRAYIVPRKGSSVNIDKLAEFVNSKVAKYKQLAGGIEIIDSIPKNASGKIMRRILREEYEKSKK